ncbi:MAG: pilus assembly protein PilM [Candidatus Omnitrophica bacterium]|nr:pilus assembly protein PilM [Candidatus Omnitrophota bacterium]
MSKGFMGGLFSKVSSDYLGVEFSSDSLRLAYIKNLPLKKEVSFLLVKDTQGLSEREIAAFLNKSLSGFKIRNAKVCYTIPSHLIITKNVEVPSQSQVEIEDIVNLQASRHTPYAREEIIIDYANIGVYRKSYTKILLVIVNRDIVRKHFEILRLAGLEPAKVTFSSETITKALSKILRLDKEQSPVGIIHIDTAFSDFNVLFKEKVIFVRSIPMGIQHLTVDKDKHYPRFIEEIKESLEVYRNEDIDASPSKIMLTGLVNEIKDFSSLLNNSIAFPSESISFSEHLSLTPEAQSVLTVSKVSSFLGAVSSAFAFEDIKVDLTPQESKLKRLFERRSREVMKTGILIFAIFIMLCVFLAGKIYLKNIYLNQLNQNFIVLHRQAEVLEKDFSRIKLIRSYLSLRGSSIETLGELYKIIPDEIKILEIRFERTGVISVKGTASSMPVIFTFVEELNKSDYFMEVETKYTTKRKEAEKDVADFEIAIVFSREEEA